MTNFLLRICNGSVEQMSATNGREIMEIHRWMIIAALVSLRVTVNDQLARLDYVIQEADVIVLRP